VNKRVVFLTGTRADYGKIKSIMNALEKSNSFELLVFVTGMHMHNEFGSTYNEVLKDGYKNVFLFINQRLGTPMDTILANTIGGFSSYVNEFKPDLIVVHGDRVEALAATIVGAMNNILVGHIEGGEVSGTIDESIRHAITKLAHIHFVANEESRRRVAQLGEHDKRIHVIGSPDIDIMLSPDLPTWDETRLRYGIKFDDFGIAMFHPVTTSYGNMSQYSKNFVAALLESGKNFIVIHPNNDMGREFIVEEYEKLMDNEKFQVFYSVRFEHFLTMLKNAEFIIGNSSAGIREASVYGTPAIDIGDRQKNRYIPSCQIVNCAYCLEEIIKSIHNLSGVKSSCTLDFGTGNSTMKFMELIAGDIIWKTPLQKYFIDKD